MFEMKNKMKTNVLGRLQNKMYFSEIFRIFFKNYFNVMNIFI